MLRSSCGLVVLFLAADTFAAQLVAAESSASSRDESREFVDFMLKDHLDHRWADELVHFDVAFKLGRPGLAATRDGDLVPFQLENVKRTGQGIVAARVWTVVSLDPGEQTTIRIAPADAPEAVKTRVSIVQDKGTLLLCNERIGLRLPRLPGQLQQSKPLGELPAPLAAVRWTGGSWLGAGQWQGDAGKLLVKEARTTVLSGDPVFVRVEQRYVLADDRFYTMTLQLGWRQDVGIVDEEAKLGEGDAAFFLDLTDAPMPTYALWRVQWTRDEGKRSWSWKRRDTEIGLSKPGVLFHLRPWSFWWEKNLTPWTGFCGDDGRYLGVLMLRPSQWTPIGWDGFRQTQVTVSVTTAGRVGLTFPVAPKKGPLKRRWAITAAPRARLWTPGEEPPPLQRQLIKYSEFPLDEVKDFGFDFTPTDPDREHPYLLFTQADIDRARRQAKTVEAVKLCADEACRYVLKACHSPRTLKNEGWEAFFKKNYRGNYQVEKLPQAYLSSDDPVLGELMAAAVKGLTKSLRDRLLDNPSPSARCIGRHGPWGSVPVVRLLIYYDAIAGRDLLTPDEKRAVRNALVLGAHFLAHPDYWNTDVGLCSANPNMTSSIHVSRGMTALFLDGHPQSEAWLAAAEAEIRRELKDWVSPGGAWVENPGYQTVSLDVIFPLAQAVRNIHGRDWFADVNLKATMDYLGFLLTPPDVRFPPEGTRHKTDRTPYTLPAIGDQFAGQLSCFNGWMARATAASDPGYSARQQFFWQAQGFYPRRRGGPTMGFVTALTDPDLPATPPAELSRAFPGFGSVLRTSWTDSKATYVAHRTGPNLHHYHDDYNSFVLYAKGAPLCLDWGNYSGARRDEAWYHNRVSWGTSKSKKRWGSTGKIVAVVSLRKTVDHSYGLSSGGGNQKDHRHLLLVKSEDPFGANYMVIRDVTENGQPKQEFYWNLWCLSEKPKIERGLVHFPGQQGVDLDVHLLSPKDARIETDEWDWRVQIYIWGWFSERQHGMRVAKSGSTEDYLAVLYPRGEGQSPAKVTTHAGGAAIEVAHGEGTDLVLLSPAKATAADAGDFSLRGEIAFARRNSNGTVRLAVLKGADASAAWGPWTLQTSGAAAVEIEDPAVAGEAIGPTALQLTLPKDYGAAKLMVDERPAKGTRDGANLAFEFGPGYHTFTLGPPQADKPQ